MSLNSMHLSLQEPQQMHVKLRFALPNLTRCRIWTCECVLAADGVLGKVEQVNWTTFSRQHRSWWILAEAMLWLFGFCTRNLNIAHTNFTKQLTISQAYEPSIDSNRGVSFFDTVFACTKLYLNLQSHSKMSYAHMHKTTSSSNYGISMGYPSNHTHIACDILSALCS